MKWILQTLAFAWASPYSLIGLTIGGLGLVSGGQVRRVGRTLEFWGGAVTWLVKRLPAGQFVLAITLGHTILGQSDASLEIARDHEWVHVRQYERWGFFMGPAYLLCSFWLWLQGKEAYRNNPFEREAYGEADLDS